jgi:hypothetical protein
MVMATFDCYLFGFDRIGATRPPYAPDLNAVISTTVRFGEIPEGAAATCHTIATIISLARANKSVSP